MKTIQHYYYYYFFFFEVMLSIALEPGKKNQLIYLSNRPETEAGSGDQRRVNRALTLATFIKLLYSQEIEKF